MAHTPLKKAINTICGGVVSIAVALSAQSVQAGVTDEDIINDAQTTHDVVGWGIGPQGQRYSPLKKINTETVKNLVPAWSFSFGGEKQRGQEAQPLVHDGRMKWCETSLAPPVHVLAVG